MKAIWDQPWCFLNWTWNSVMGLFPSYGIFQVKLAVLDDVETS